MNVKNAFEVSGKSASTQLLRHSPFKEACTRPYAERMKAALSLRQKPSYIRVEREYDIKYETSPNRKKLLLLRARTKGSHSRTPDRQSHTPDQQIRTPERGLRTPELRVQSKGTLSSYQTPEAIDFERRPLGKPVDSFAQLIQRSSALQKQEKENTASLTQRMVLRKTRIPSVDSSLFTSSEMQRAVQDFQGNFYSKRMVSTLRRNWKRSYKAEEAKHA